MVELREFGGSDVEWALAVAVGGPLFFAPAEEPRLTVLADGMFVGLVWYSGLDGVSAYVTVGLTVLGKGYGSAVAQHAARYGFEQLGVHRLATTVVVGNEAAHRIARKWGRGEGRLREAFKDEQGKYRDVMIFALLRSEWKG